MKTATEIIDETVAFYSEDPSRRAIDGDNACMYLTPEGRKCAVGRVLQEESLQDVEPLFGGVITLIVHLLYLEAHETGDTTFLEKIVEVHNESCATYSEDEIELADLYPVPASDLVLEEVLDAVPMEQFIRRDYANALDRYLKPEYRGHSIEFWEEVQNLHDHPAYWSESGGKFLTEEVVNLKNKYQR